MRKFTITLLALLSSASTALGSVNRGAPELRECSTFKEEVTRHVSHFSPVDFFAAEGVEILFFADSLSNDSKVVAIGDPVTLNRAVANAEAAGWKHELYPCTIEGKTQLLVLGTLRKELPSI